MKKVQDHYFKRAKREGYPARSVYKLDEAQQKYGFLKKGDKVLDLGCHPGSWSMYAGQQVGPSGLVVGIDIQKGGVNRRPKSSDLKILQGDVNDPAAMEAVRKICPEFNVLISDMAPKTTGSKWTDQQHSLDLAWMVLDVAAVFLKLGGSFYCKVFDGEDFQKFVTEMKKYFTKVKAVKPKSSRTESTEVFVLGLGYLKNNPVRGLSSERPLIT